MQENPNTEEQELSKEAPLLFGNRLAVEKAPEGYFDTLADHVAKRILEAPKDITAPKRSKLRLIKSLGIAAAIAIGILFLKPDSIKPAGDVTATAEMHADDFNYLMDIEEDVIMDFYAEMLDAESEAFIDYLMEEMEYEEIILTLEI